jgi:hypothetical protein
VQLFNIQRYVRTSLRIIGKHTIIQLTYEPRTNPSSISSLWLTTSPDQDAALVTEAQRDRFRQYKGAEGCYQLNWRGMYGYFETNRSRSQSTTCCGEGCASRWTQIIPSRIWGSHGCEHGDSPGDGGSKDLWNVGKLLPDYTALQPIRRPSSWTIPPSICWEQCGSPVGVIFTDESTFSFANGGPILVYRPRGERYNSQYVSTSTRSGRVSVHCWGWISHEGWNTPSYGKARGRPSI